MASGARFEVALVRCATLVISAVVDCHPSVRVSFENNWGDAEALVVASGGCVVEVLRT